VVGGSIDTVFSATDLEIDNDVLKATFADGSQQSINLSVNASNVSVQPSGTLTSTNTQDALEELQSDIDDVKNTVSNLHTPVQRTSQLANDGSDGLHPYYSDLTFSILPVFDSLEEATSVLGINKSFRYSVGNIDGESTTVIHITR